MTTFQDQPPQSRRALRQEERGERNASEEIVDGPDSGRPAPSGRRARAAAPDEAPAAAETAPEVHDSAVATPFPFADQVEATSDDAGHPGFRLRDFSPELGSARAESRSANDWAPAGTEESVPLDYQTQGGPVGSAYVSPYSRRAMRAEAPAVPAPVEEPSFDSLFADLTVESNDEGDSDVAADAAPEQQSAPVEADPVIPVAVPVVDTELVEPVAVAPEERTLSRREWRAMRAQAEAETEAAAAAAAGGAVVSELDSDVPTSDEPVVDEPVDSEPVVDDAPVAPVVEAPAEAEPNGIDIFFQEPEAEPQPEAFGEPAPAFIPPLVEPEVERQSALSDAMAEFEALTRGAQAESSTAETAFPSALLGGPASVPLFTPPAVPVDDEPAAPVDVEPEPQPEPEKVDFTPPAEAAPTAAPSAPFSFLLSPPPVVEPVVAPAVAPTVAPAEAAASAPDAAATSAYQPPVGHWSRQAELDDESQPFENTLSRDVGGGNVATTTNALVLPMIPQRDDFSSVLNATGEIMVTGTINLPGSVGTTGRDSRHYDDPEVDHLFDAFDNEVANTDSAPVRAITAVSSHTATRGGIESGRKQSNRMLNVLLVTATVMAVAVVGLLIAGFVFGIF
jgi:hypothetical protein